MLAREDPGNADGPASAFWRQDGMPEGVLEPGAAPLVGLVGDRGSVEGLRLLDGDLVLKIEHGGAAFTVDNVEQNQMDVPLGPYYLVWDNISSPALLAEGARNWPYQVKEVHLVSLSDDALLPAGLDARFREGAELVRTHCLSCHKVNGFGGAKFEGNLAEIMKDYGRADFLHLVLTPASARSGATMPALSDRLSEAERQRIAESMFDYLRTVPVRPSRSPSES